MLITRPQIEEFITLQQKVLSRMAELYTAEVLRYDLRSLPKTGEFSLENNSWSFTRHGDGITFECHSIKAIFDVEIRVHRGDHLTAYRLSLYLERKTGKEIEERDIEKQMQDLANTGWLAVLRNSKLFRLSDPSDVKPIEDARIANQIFPLLHQFNQRNRKNRQSDGPVTVDLY